MLVEEIQRKIICLRKLFKHYQNYIDLIGIVSCFKNFTILLELDCVLPDLIVGN